MTGRERELIPKTFNNRWIWSEPGSEKEINAFRLDNTKYSIEDKVDNNEKISKLFEGINHPLNSSLLNGLFWHDKIEVIEYTFKLQKLWSRWGKLSLFTKTSMIDPFHFGERYDLKVFR